MNINMIKKSIKFSSDVVKITSEYAEKMDNFFSNIENQKTHEFCYKSYKQFSDSIKTQAKLRGLIK